MPYEIEADGVVIMPGITYKDTAKNLANKTVRESQAATTLVYEVDEAGKRSRIVWQCTRTKWGIQRGRPIA